MFLHASHLSFIVSFVNFAISPSLKKITFQRYNKTGQNKQFRLGVTSPLPRDFLKICLDMGITAKLDRREVMGGLFADGEPMRDLPDVEGKWLL
jgi:hypothetical protein